MANCIWCKGPTHHEPEEHILPEGLVGEARFTVGRATTAIVRLVLENDQVCRQCNLKRLAPLDGYLQKQLGIFKVFLNRTGTKHGKAAKVEKPGIYAVHRSNGPHIHLSSENKKIVTQDGIVIQPPQNHPEAARVTGFQKIGPVAELQFTVPIRFGKWFFRALHKIAFEMLCFQEGVEFVLNPQFNPIRDYVLRGRGSREIFMSRELNTGEWGMPSVTMHKISGEADWIAELRLGPVFFVDLSPDGVYGAGIEKELEEKGFMRVSEKVGIAKQETREVHITQ